MPKADLNLRLKRLMTLSKADRIRFRSDLVGDDPTLFKRRLWTRAPEEKLLQFLRTMPPLSDFIREYKQVKQSKAVIDRKTDWVIGQGFKPAQEDRLDEEGYDTTIAEAVTRFPYFDANGFQPIALPTVTGRAWPTAIVHRAGFAEGFLAPHILIPQGVERSIGRVRAAYSEQSLVFQHSLQAVIVPVGAERSAKILTAVLNSSLAAWVYFHDTANLGADRAKVHQGELLKLPFDLPENMPDPERAKAAGDELIRLVDGELAHANDVLITPRDTLGEIDALVFTYYGLDEADIALVEDTFRYIIPAMQPRRSGGLQKIWDKSDPGHRKNYAAMLCDALAPYFRQPVSATLAARSSDVAVLKLTIGQEVTRYSEDQSPAYETFLRSIQASLPVALPGNVQLVPHLRFVIGSDMYLIKPVQLRHWLRSTALADAEQIGAEFTAAAVRADLVGETYAER